MTNDVMNEVVVSEAKGINVKDVAVKAGTAALGALAGYAIYKAVRFVMNKVSTKEEPEGLALLLPFRALLGLALTVGPLCRVGLRTLHHVAPKIVAKHVERVIDRLIPPRGCLVHHLWRDRTTVVVVEEIDKDAAQQQDGQQEEDDAQSPGGQTAPQTTFIGLCHCFFFLFLQK